MKRTANQSESDDDDISIVSSHANIPHSVVTSPVFAAFLREIVKNKDMLRLNKGNRWNLWTIASYAGLVNPSPNFPGVVTVTINYETNPGESMHGSRDERLSSDYQAYRVLSRKIGVDFIVTMTVYYWTTRSQ